VKEQRTKERRHDFDSAQTFPFVDCAGRIVHRDRRTIPDRRLNSIRLEVVLLRAVHIGRGWRH
jgi:hypothetical protein